MVKIFLDGADLDELQRLEARIDGVTTNPTLVRRAGYTELRGFVRTALLLTSKPVSVEVLADDLITMEKQAREIASWGDNVFVKIPVMTSSGDSTGLLIHLLASEGVKVNVTAVFTLDQIRTVARQLNPTTPAIISIFAGRIADTLVDPTPLFTTARHVAHDKTEILWASAREAYNVKQAEQAGADIITLSPALFAKLSLKGKSLTDYSRETVGEFVRDAQGIQL